MKITRGIVIAAAAAAVFSLSTPPAWAVPSTVRVSVGAGNPGAQANGNNYNAVVSNGGRFVAFDSPASNLVPGDTNNTSDVFVRDTLNNTTRRISVANGSPGAQGLCEPGRADCDGAGHPAMSPDGRYVAFESDFANLVAGDTNNNYDMFVRDLVNNTTVRVSVTNSGAQTNGRISPSFPSISNDGKRVAFISEAKEFVGESDFTNDVFVRDLANNTTTLVSVTTSGKPNPTQNTGMTRTRISGDGKLVAFQNKTLTFVSGDTNGKSDVFVRDLAAKKTTRVSLSSAGAQGNGDSFLYSISTNGSVIGFTSQASNLVSGDTNGKEDAFIRKGTQTIRVDVSSSGAQANNQSICSAVSGDGRYVAFCSTATNLVNDDTNSKVDTFWRDTQTGTTRRVSVSTSGVQGNNISPWPVISPDGKFVGYETDATNLVSRDTNGKRDILLSGPLF